MGEVQGESGERFDAIIRQGKTYVVSTSTGREYGPYADAISAALEIRKLLKISQPTTSPQQDDEVKP